jgi:hypothetical protein
VSELVASSTVRTGQDKEEAITGIASGQHGVITRTQLLNLGLSSDAIERRLRAKRLRPLQRGVYVAGPLIPSHAHDMAAVLSCGDHAVLSHGSASRTWSLPFDGSRRGSIEITIPPGGRHRRPGIRIHRLLLGQDETTRFQNIPITTPARTLCDIAGLVTERTLERAVAEALANRLTTRRQVEILLVRHRHLHGANRLRALLATGSPPALTRSQAEETFLMLIRQARIAAPGVLAPAGLRVMRITWRQIRDEPVALIIRVARALECAS